MQTTTHYALKKPDGTDTYNHQANDNANLDTIDAQMYANAQAAAAAAVLGTSNQTVNKFMALNQRIDTRSTTETYDANGNLTQVVEKDGSTTVKTTNLTYSNGNLTQVQELIGSNTVTTTLNYDGNNNLTGTSRAVS